MELNDNDIKLGTEETKEEKALKLQSRLYASYAESGFIIPKHVIYK